MIHSKPQNHQRSRLIFGPPYNTDRMSAVVLSCAFISGGRWERDIVKEESNLLTK